MSLSEAEELVGSFAEMIVEVRDPSEVWPSMLQELQRAIGFDAGYIAASWGNATEGRGAVAEHDEPFLKRNLGRFLAEIRPEEVALYADQARVHHDVWSRPRQLELAVFREVLDPTGMRHMIVRVSVRHGNVAGFNLERRDVAFPYTERDLHLVDLVAPFLHIVEVLTLRSQDDTIALVFASEHGLTARESEFVALTARGLQNTEIAMLTGVTVNTVRNTLVRVFEKVGVSNRAELAYLASKPAVSHRGQPVLVPPPSRLPDDGLKVFSARVAQVSAGNADGEPLPRPTFRPAHIVYTPPLTSI
jgi:DNA-binding CsgD family transcriptional regulator